MNKRTKLNKEFEMYPIISVQDELLIKPSKKELKETLQLLSNGQRNDFMRFDKPIINNSDYKSYLLFNYNDKHVELRFYENHTEFVYTHFFTIRYDISENKGILEMRKLFNIDSK